MPLTGVVDQVMKSKFILNHNFSTRASSTDNSIKGKVAFEASFSSLLPYTNRFSLLMCKEEKDNLIHLLILKDQ